MQLEIRFCFARALKTAVYIRHGIGWEPVRRKEGQAGAWDLPHVLKATAMGKTDSSYSQGSRGQKWLLGENEKEVLSLCCGKECSSNLCCPIMNGLPHTLVMGSLTYFEKI